MVSCFPFESQSKISSLRGRYLSPLHSTCMGILTVPQTGFRELSIRSLFQTTVYAPSSFSLLYDNMDIYINILIKLHWYHISIVLYLEATIKGSDVPKNPSLLLRRIPRKAAQNKSRVFVWDSARRSKWPLVVVIITVVVVIYIWIKLNTYYYKEYNCIRMKDILLLARDQCRRHFLISGHHQACQQKCCLSQESMLCKVGHSFSRLEMIHTNRHLYMNIKIILVS